MKYQFTKKDKKEIRALLTFLSGVLGGTPIKRIYFDKGKDADEISIQRWDDESQNEFTEYKQKLKKPRGKKHYH